MSSGQKRPSKLESALSLGLILILIIIATGLIKIQFTSQANQAEVFVPENFDILGLPETYTEENLYNKINGKAPLYTESGFVKLTTQRYIHTENEELTFEIYTYDMDNVKNAFAVYSQQKRPDAKSLPGIKFAYSTSNAAYLVHGKYYIELVGASDDPMLINAIIKSAKKLPEILNQPGKITIDELDLFPSENLIPGSEKLYLKNAFGCAGLNNLFTAKYKVENYHVTTFISVHNDNKDAQKTFTLYKNFLVENGGIINQKTSENPNAELVEVFGLYELIAIKGEYFLGIHEFEVTPQSTQPFKLIFHNLPDNKKESK